MPGNLRSRLLFYVVGGALLVYLFILGRGVYLSLSGRSPELIKGAEEQDAEFPPYRKGGGQHLQREGEEDLSDLIDGRENPLIDDSIERPGRRKKHHTGAGQGLDGSPGVSDSMRILDVDLADIARYDESRESYVLNKLDLYSTQKVQDNLASLLKVLNRKDMPSDYFRRAEYHAAYQEIDQSYSDTFIWPYFTNAEAKANFFLYLFTQYAADNQTWRPYEKDRADCSQFSQRIYLFLSPDEIYIPDEDYFIFLFADTESRSERKKRCNKIPGVSYTLITPYQLKRESTFPVESHAMISFAPDDNPEHRILGEPQNGAFERFGGDIGQILNKDYTKHPLICRLGRVTSIEGSDAHEALMETTEFFLIPRTIFWNRQYSIDDPRWSYGERPVRLGGNTYPFFDLLTSYVSRVLNNQPLDRADFVRSLETIAWGAKPPDFRAEGAIADSVDVLMHGLMDLDKSDVKKLLVTMADLEYQVTGNPGFSSQAKGLVREISYLMRLKCTPFL